MIPALILTVCLLVAALAIALACAGAPQMPPHPDSHPVTEPPPTPQRLINADAKRVGAAASVAAYAYQALDRASMDTPPPNLREPKGCGAQWTCERFGTVGHDFTTCPDCHERFMARGQEKTP